MSRLIGSYPKVGIRPVIDGRRGPLKVREGLEDQAMSMAKAAAWVQGRDYVVPNDVKLIYPATITHRLILTPEAKASGQSAEAILNDIMAHTAPPATRG